MENSVEEVREGSRKVMEKGRGNWRGERREEEGY